MKLDIYINYRGTCEEAFRFYEEHLGGRITMVQRHGDQPKREGIPAGWEQKILHARIEIGDTVLMGADIPAAEPMRSAYLSLRVDSDAEAERIYALLADGGEIFVKLDKTFYASRFGMLRDRFGTSWMVMNEEGN